MQILNQSFFKFLILLVSIIIFKVAYAEKKIKFVAEIEAPENVVERVEKLMKELDGNANQNQITKQIDYWQKEGERVLNKVLKSFGYYEAIIEMLHTNNDDEHEIKFLVNLGDRYTVSSVKFTFVENSNQDIKLLDINDLQTKLGQNIDVLTIEADEQTILEYIEENNCLLNISVGHQARMNHLNDYIDLEFIIDAGPQTTVKELNLVGLKTVKDSYARKLTKIVPGQCYKQSYVVKARKNLQKSNLFLSTLPEVPDQVDENSQVPITLNLQERKRRTLKYGAIFSTDVGIGGSVEWTHRNLWGAGENLTLRLNGNAKEKTSELLYNKPFFLQDNQSLNIKGKYETEKTQGFNATIADVAVLVDRKIRKHTRVGGGGKVSYTKQTEFANLNMPNQTFLLFSIPLYAEYDNRDSIVDPREGYLGRIDVEPFQSIKLDDDPFVKTELTGKTYFKIHKNSVLALRASTGALFGGTESDIPVSEKYFLGGGRSVRGYKLDSIGDLNSKGSVIGGLSFVELSSELRFRSQGNFGMVYFVDCGYAYQSRLPKFNNLKFGVGFGLRYYTDFVPFGIDIAFPLNKRDKIDSNVSIYLGIRQSF